MILTESELGYNKKNVIEIAHNGGLSAQEAVAFHYLCGSPLLDDNPDWNVGLHWLKKASENGSIYAARCLDRIKKNPKDRTFGGISPTASQLLINRGDFPHDN